MNHTTVVSTRTHSLSSRLVSAPEQLRHDFIVTSALANAAFWIVLGTLSGYLLRKTMSTV